MTTLEPAKEDIATDAEDVEKALRLGERIAETGAIGREQARVWAMRDVYGIRRAITAEVLEKNPSTVNSNLRYARENIEALRECARIIEEAIDEADTDE